MTYGTQIIIISLNNHKSTASVSLFLLLLKKVAIKSLSDYLIQITNAFQSISRHKYAYMFEQIYRESFVSEMLENLHNDLLSLHFSSFEGQRKTNNNESEKRKTNAKRCMRILRGKYLINLKGAECSKTNDPYRIAGSNVQWKIKYDNNNNNKTQYLDFNYVEFHQQG